LKAWFVYIAMEKEQRPTAHQDTLTEDEVKAEEEAARHN
jgi:hypothetical protein